MERLTLVLIEEFDQNNMLETERSHVFSLFCSREAILPVLGKTPKSLPPSF